MNTNSEGIKQWILQTLEKHKEGLTISDLARLLDTHRQTVTKYVLVLEALGRIHRRRIGAVTLHYLKKDWERLRK